jgi:hypothetical protein
MKIKNIFYTLAVFLFAFIMTTSSAFATPPIAGGYQPIEINNDIRTIAEFAVQAQEKREHKPLKLVAISMAAQQVVDGVNYQLELTVTRGNNSYRATAIVFQSVNVTYELTSWQWQPNR